MIANIKNDLMTYFLEILREVTWSTKGFQEIYKNSMRLVIVIPLNCSPFSIQPLQLQLRMQISASTHPCIHCAFTQRLVNLRPELVQRRIFSAWRIWTFRFLRIPLIFKSIKTGEIPILFTLTHLHRVTLRTSFEKKQQKISFRSRKTFFRFPPFFRFFIVKKIKNCGKNKRTKENISVKFSILQFWVVCEEEKFRVACCLCGAPERVKKWKIRLENLDTNSTL